MLRSYQILVSTLVLGASALSLSACGQQGPLYLPTEPAPAKRSTLPETVLRSGSVNATQPDAQMTPSSAMPPAPAASAASPTPQ